MKKPIIIANWKSHMVKTDVTNWCQEIGEKKADMEGKDIIVCPPYVYLPRLTQLQRENALPIAIGAQDISPFSEGAYTGEVHGKQIKEYGDFVIIGHSERRTHFGDTDEVVAEKVKQAVAVGLTPILCIQNENTPIPSGVTIVAYEPISAIGTGHPDSPEDADFVAKTVKEKSSIQFVLYGGSVTPEDVSSFTRCEHIDGVLVGSASLSGITFSQIISHA